MDKNAHHGGHENATEHDHKQKRTDHEGHVKHDKCDHQNHHEMMIKDFKTRLLISLIVTVPILILSPMIQEWVNAKIAFPGSNYLLFALSAFIYFYGGRPFLKGLIDELKEKKPGMMTLIAMAITVAFLYSTA
ncbi:MAG: heavy metal translocating P-type ATPase, partial [Clostridiales bacterium]|nr:heavy metal translocating P-type ATPase [Clostridiales bacterium]